MASLADANRINNRPVSNARDIFESLSGRVALNVPCSETSTHVDLFDEYQ